MLLKNLPHFRSTPGWSRFRGWRRGRPFAGALLTVLAGIEMFFSGQLDLGNIHVQVGIEGLQSTIIPCSWSPSGCSRCSHPCIGSSTA
ncbi:MAG: DUF6114 domain-containing protein [Galbitalea sp.]